MPEVTIVIPTRNRTRYLARAVRSVLAQTFADWELVVVDDGSTEEVSQAIDAFYDPRITCRRIFPARGLPSARNMGIESSSGELIAFLDDDDTWTENKLARQVEKFNVGPPSLGLVYAGFRWVDEGGRVLRIAHPTARGDVYRTLLVSNITAPSSVMVRREVIDKAGAFDPSMLVFEDWEAWLRWSRVCTFDYLSEPMVDYTVHAASMTRKFTADQYAKLFDMLQRDLQLQPRRVRQRAMSLQSVLLASMYLHQNRWAEARRESWRALRSNPLDIRNYLRLSWCITPVTSKAYLAAVARKDRMLARLGR